MLDGFLGFDPIAVNKTHTHIHNTSVVNARKKMKQVGRQSIMRTDTSKSEENKADSLPENTPTSTEPHNFYISLIKSPDTPINTVGNGRAKHERREMGIESDKGAKGITKLQTVSVLPQ